MLRITRQTDYGVILLTHLASRPARVANAPDLAAETALPLPMVSKVLKGLAVEGLLASHRGAKGGYSLARPPERITMAEVIAALEGPVAMTECIAFGPGQCDHEAGCPTRGNWRRINEAILHALEGLTLADMRQPLPAVAARRHDIELIG